MKKLFLTLALFFGFCGVSFAGLSEDNYPVKSSYTEVATTGWVVFSTGPTRFEGIVISSPAPNSFIVFLRSTSPFVTPNLATQTLVSTNYVASNQATQNVDLYGMTNTSYTIINKVGTAKVTYFFRLIGGTANVTPPGLTASGQE